MGRVRNGLGRTTAGLLVVLALGAVSCGVLDESDPAPPAATSDASAQSEAIEAAEATLRAFFAVKGSAEEPLSARIDEQARYLTSRDVHPTAAYEGGMSGPAGITDEEVSVELSDSRQVGDEVLIDFVFKSAGVSYAFIDGELQLDQASPQESHWDGTATLEQRGDTWLISDFDLDSFGGEVG